MIAEQEQQTEARIDHETALALAAQSVIDAAVFLSEFGHWEEWQYFASVNLGRMQDLQTTLDSWRALGGQTTEERT